VNLWVVVAIIVGACGITCGLLVALDRWGPRDVFVSDSARGAAVYTVVGTSFAVLMAFVVLIAFQSFNDAKNGSQQESDALLQLFRAAEYFPQGQREEVQQDLICYGRAVIARDWPDMQHDERSPVVDAWAYELQRHYRGLQVRTAQQQDAFADLLDLSQDRADGRRLRETQAASTVTAPVWLILGLGAVINIGLALLFIDRRGESLAVQAIMLASLTAVVVGTLLLIYFLDHPYADAPGGIRPTEMESTVSVMQAERPGLRAHCTASGIPI